MFFTTCHSTSEPSDATEASSEQTEAGLKLTRTLKTQEKSKEEEEEHYNKKKNDKKKKNNKNAKKTLKKKTHQEEPS